MNSTNLKSIDCLQYVIKSTSGIYSHTRKKRKKIPTPKSEVEPFKINTFLSSGNYLRTVFDSFREDFLNVNIEL